MSPTRPAVFGEMDDDDDNDEVFEVADSSLNGPQHPMYRPSVDLRVRKEEMIAANSLDTGYRGYVAPTQPEDPLPVEEIIHKV